MNDLNQHEGPAANPDDMRWATSTPSTETTPGEMEADLAQMLQPGWSQLADAVIDQSEAVHGPDRTDWRRLQIGRNLPSAAVAVLVPIHGTTAAGWVAHAIAAGGITAPVTAPAGAALAVVGAAWLGRHVPGLLGVVCGASWSILAAATRSLWRFVRSPHGWWLTRPLIWAGACGVLIVSWRVIVHTLTGA